MQRVVVPFSSTVYLPAPTGAAGPVAGDGIYIKATGVTGSAGPTGPSSAIHPNGAFIEDPLNPNSTQTGPVILTNVGADALFVFEASTTLPSGATAAAFWRLWN